MDQERRRSSFLPLQFDMRKDAETMKCCSIPFPNAYSRNKAPYTCRRVRVSQCQGGRVLMALRLWRSRRSQRGFLSGLFRQRAICSDAYCGKLLLHRFLQRGDL